MSLLTRNSDLAFWILNSGFRVLKFCQLSVVSCLLSVSHTMKINRITLREISLPLVDFFETSFGRTQDRRVLLVEIQ